MYGYVYMTINIFNGKRYIGQHKSRYFDLFYKGSGFLIRQAFEKYGFDNFAIELLDTAESFEELNQKEYYWIEYYNAVDSDEFYNIIPGGGSIDISGSSNPNYNNHKLKGIKFTEEHKDKIRQAMKDRICINNGHITKLIKSEELDYYIKIGFVVGQLDSFKSKVSKNSSNRIRINNGIIEKFVKPEELYDYLQNGFVTGILRNMQHTSESREKIRQSSVGKIVINNGQIVKRVYPEEYETKYSDWNRGFLNKTKKKMSIKNSGSNNPMYGRIRKGSDAPTYGKHINVGKRWMNNGLTNRFVNEEDQSKLFKLGWKFGMLKGGAKNE